jgi:hypothetical protein
MNRAIFLTALLAGNVLAPLSGKTPPPAAASVKPESLGFDTARLARLSSVMQGFIDR